MFDGLLVNIVNFAQPCFPSERKLDKFTEPILVKCKKQNMFYCPPYTRIFQQNRKSNKEIHTLTYHHIIIYVRASIHYVNHYIRTRICPYMNKTMNHYVTNIPTFLCCARVHSCCPNFFLKKNASIEWETRVGGKMTEAKSKSSAWLSFEPFISYIN